MVNLFFEWAKRVSDRTGFMVEEELLPKLCKNTYDPGFQSVYGFDEDAAKEIKESKRSVGFDRFTPYARCLTIDIDGTGPEDADRRLAVVEERLEGHQYSVWFSGGKGYHVILPHELIGSKHLPHSHKTFVEKTLGLDTDASIYRPASLIALPGRVHHKTKVRKRLVKEVAGKPLEFPIVEKPDRQQFDNISVDLNSLESGLLRLLSLSSLEPNIGNRHVSIWGVSKDLAKAGLQMGTALDLMLRINQTWGNRKTPEEVLNAVAQAYNNS